MMMPTDDAMRWWGAHVAVASSGFILFWRASRRFVGSLKKEVQYRSGAPPGLVVIVG
jgi:hypothetical protein